MHKILIALLFLACSSCNNGDSATAAMKDTAASSQTIHTNISDAVVTNKQPVMLNGCYQMAQKRDTATLSLALKDSTITGNLQYNLYQKDRNIGSLKGVLRGNTIYADYRFQSEGTTSVREVVFKIQDSVLLQGFGELTEKNGKVVFKNKENLQFQTTNPFHKVACP